MSGRSASPLALAVTSFGAALVGALLSVVNVGMLQLLYGRSGVQPGSRTTTGELLPALGFVSVLSLASVGAQPIFSALAAPAVLGKDPRSLRAMRLVAFVAVAPWTAVAGFGLLHQLSVVRGVACARDVRVQGAGCDGAGAPFRSGCVAGGRACTLATAGIALSLASLVLAGVAVWLVVRATSLALAAAAQPPGGEQEAAPAREPPTRRRLRRWGGGARGVEHEEDEGEGGPDDHVLRAMRPVWTSSPRASRPRQRGDANRARAAEARAWARAPAEAVDADADDETDAGAEAGPAPELRRLLP